MASHKRNFENYLHPGYVAFQLEGKEFEENVAKRFQAFLNELLEGIPDKGEPAEPYLYNSHMGQCVRSLDNAMEEYMKGVKAFHNKSKATIERDATKVAKTT